MATERGKRNVALLMEHIAQVEAGLIPEDSPPDFVLPKPVDEKGLPWWFGPDYDPTPEAIESFEEPIPATEEPQGGSVRPSVA